jgi:hypothetical protein
MRGRAGVCEECHRQYNGICNPCTDRGRH